MRTNDEITEKDYPDVQPDDSQVQTTALVSTHSLRDEETEQTKFSITEILGSGLIGHKFLRRNWGVIAVLILLSVIYVSNRYMADQEMITISDLQRELEEVRYRALTHNSELTTRCRQSQIEQRLKEAGDSTLKAAKEPPFIIHRDNKR